MMTNTIKNCSSDQQARKKEAEERESEETSRKQ